MREKTLLIIFIGLLTTNCVRKQVIHIYSSDKSQCISIVTEKDKRIIINGYHKNQTTTNYIILNIGNLDPLGDCIHICWKENGWEAVIHGSLIIKSALDTTKFLFHTSLEKDSFGIPNENKYRKDGCAIFDFYSMKLSPNKGAIVEK